MSTAALNSAFLIFVLKKIQYKQEIFQTIIIIIS